MANSRLTILQSNTVYVPGLLSYQVTLQVTNAQNITTNVFVKQRLKTSTNQINNIFVAIATPEQLETLGVGTPTADTSYYLDSQICLVANTVEYLESVVNTILSELQNLCTDVQLLDNIEQSSIYTITSGNISVNTYQSHTHYRIPITAQPAGTPVTTNGIVTIPSPNTSLPGWLPITSGVPTGYRWYYNIAEDSSLTLLFPPRADYLQYAHIEHNGVTDDDGNVLINSVGIFWKDNNAGQCPWPSDYISPEVPGGATGLSECVLIFDFIV